jgi:hypothetical protein
MHPTVMYELAKIRSAEMIEDAERHRRLRDAASGRPRAIDSPSLPDRIRTLLFGGAPRVRRAGAGA